MNGLSFHWRTYVALASDWTRKNLVGLPIDLFREFRAGLFRWIGYPLDPTDSDEYREVRAWVDEAKPPEPGLSDRIEYIDARSMDAYEELTALFEGCRKHCEGMIKTNGALMIGVPGFFKATDNTVPLGVKLAIALLSVSMVICLLGMRRMTRPLGVEARYLYDRLTKDQDNRVRMFAILQRELACIRLTVIVNRESAVSNIALFFSVLGFLVLVVSLLFF